jgi:hypothetical protein
MRVFSVTGPLADPDSAPAPNGVRPVVHHHELADVPVQLIGGSSPEGLQILQAVLEQDSLDGLQPVLPYLALVANNTNRRLIAVALRYEGKDRSGSGVTLADCSLWNSQNELAEMLQPGEIGVMDPFVGLNCVLPRGGNALSESRVPDDLEERADRYLVFPRIDITLDAIVFEDGTLAGADRSGLQRRITAFIQTETTLRAEVTRRPMAEAEEYLTSKLDGDDWHLSGTAQSIISMLKSASSEQEFRRRVDSALGSPIPLPHR